jgi:lysozyme
MLSGCGAAGTGPVGFEPLNYPRPHDYPIHGIDVSKFQGDIDWSKVADSGVKFAWIKASEGGDRADERFSANWQGAKAAGLPHGAYHFVYWCRPPMEEMANFEQNAPAEPDALPPVLDVEATPTSRTCHRQLTEESAIRDMQVMLNEMERHYGKRPVIYTTVDFYQAILADGAFKDYPIWVRSTKYHPAVKYGSRAWRFWQYQSDAYVPGIATKVDKDAFAGNAEQWTAFLTQPGAGRSEIPPGAPLRALSQQAAAPAEEIRPPEGIQEAAEALAPADRPLEPVTDRSGAGQ